MSANVKKGKTTMCFLIEAVPPMKYYLKKNLIMNESDLTTNL